MSAKKTFDPTYTLKTKLSGLTNYLVWFLIIVLAVSTVRNMGKVTRIRSEIGRENERIAKMKSYNEDLERQILETENPQFVETEIRNKLGLVREGETVVVLPDNDILRRLAPKLTAEEDVLPPPTWRKWLNLFSPQ